MYYSLHYASFCSFIALQLTYFPLLFNELGFSAFEISLLGVASTLGTIGGAPSFLAVSHYFVSPFRLLRVTVTALPVLLLPLALLERFELFIVPWALFFWVVRAPATLVDNQAIRDSMAGDIRFEPVRAFGSLGFVVSTFIAGVIIDFMGTRAALILMFLSAGLLIYADSGLASRLPRHTTRRETQNTIRRNGSMHEFSKVALCMMCIWAAHAGSALYFSLYLESLGWSATLISITWNIAVASEVLMFFLFHRLYERYSLVKILRFSILIGAFRWLVLSSTVDTALILVTGTLHAFSFAATYSVSLRLTHALLPDDLRDRGQGILSVAGPGIGILLGNLLAGAAARSLTSYRDVQILFIGASGLMTAAYAVALTLQTTQARPTSKEV